MLKSRTCRIAAIAVLAAAASPCAHAVEPPDTATLIGLLQTGFKCAPAVPAGNLYRYIGDTSVFRVNVDSSAGNYEIAFNFRDIETVRVTASDITFACRNNSGCIARPSSSGPPNQFVFRACRADIAESVRLAADHLIRMNDGTPFKPLPTIWTNLAPEPRTPPRIEPRIEPAPEPKTAPYWSHNDSTLDLVAQGTSRKFFYRDPSR